MTETNATQYTGSAAVPRAVAAVPPVGGQRPGSFWQRWKEWERAHGTVPSPASGRAA